MTFSWRYRSPLLKVLNRDTRVDVGMSVGEYRLVKKHRVVLRAEITGQKKVAE